MAREFKRSDRVADALQRSLAQIVQQEVRDPRLSMVNINSVSVSRDLALAKIFVTFVGISDKKESEAQVKILNNAASYLRNQVARDLDIRTTPKLSFFYDSSSVHGQELSSLIDKVVASDKARRESNDEE